MEEKIYLIYDSAGTFQGFFTKETADNLLNEQSGLRKAPVSPKMHKYLMNCSPNFLINTDLVKEDETEIDDKKFITVIPNEINNDELKRKFTGDMKNRCRFYIISGADVELSTGQIKHFSFKLEDQINLTALVTNHTKDEQIYYHADEENDTLYNYADIVTIYKTLYNNKIYNQIYTEVLCNWINNHFTAETIDEKQNVISYGFCTDDMRERIGELYDSQKLL